jgi:hypothetical protein
MYFMFMHILGIWLNYRSIFHTTLDNLESFLWLLIWCIVHLIKDIKGVRDKNPGIDQMLYIWLGDVMANRFKYQIVKEWEEAIFGGLLREWLKIFNWVLKETRILIKFLSTAWVDNWQGSS